MYYAVRDRAGGQGLTLLIQVEARAAVMESSTTSAEWKLEVERVLPQLKVQLRTETKDWRSHLSEMLTNKSEIEGALKHTNVSRPGTRPRHAQSCADYLGPAKQAARECVQGAGEDRVPGTIHQYAVGRVDPRVPVRPRWLCGEQQQVWVTKGISRFRRLDAHAPLGTRSRQAPSPTYPENLPS